MNYVVIDTNTLLHYSQIDSIDWCRTLNLGELVLYIPLQVVKELDRKKHQSESGKLKNRINKVVDYLLSVRQPNFREIRTFTTIQIAKSQPKTTFIQELGLDKDIPDSYILADCIRLAEENSVVLITHDASMRLQAEGLGIPTETLPDKYRNQEPLEASQLEILKLRKELEEIRTRDPRLEIEWCSGGNQAGVNLFATPPYTQEWIDQMIVTEKLGLPPRNRIDEIRRSQSPISITDFLFGPQYISEAEYDRYNNELKQYYADFQKALSQYHSKLIASRSTVELRIQIMNIGHSPAKNCRLTLNSSPGCRFAEPPEDPGLHLPSAPRLPQSQMEIHENLVKKINGIDGPLGSILFGPKARKKETPPHFDVLHKSQARFVIEKLFHKDIQVLPTLSVEVEDTTENIEFVAQIIADNVPDVVETTVSLAVSRTP
jgi:rRNA-processing protein FCF1